MSSNNNFHRLWLFVLILFLLCGSTWPWQKQQKRVLVVFEIQIINAIGNFSLGLERDLRSGTTGFGHTNEVIKKSYYANIGDYVFAWVTGRHWDKTDPSHQVVCRIIVNGKNIYIDAAQGSPGVETLAHCKGPVYIPKDDKQKQRGPWWNPESQ